MVMMQVSPVSSCSVLIHKLN